MKRVVPLYLLLALIAGACAPLSLISSPASQEPTETIIHDTREPVVRPTPTKLPAGEDSQNSRRHLEALAGIGARWSGSEQEVEAGQYIVNAFDEMGYDSTFQPFTARGDDGETIDSANIISIKEGDSSNGIVVGAHYDSSDEGLGADDNASGVAVMLDVAERVKNESTPYTIHFVAFGAEEAGLLGSQTFVSSMSSAETRNIVLFVNLDSLIAGDIAYIYSLENEASARDWTLTWAAANGYDLQTVHNVDLSDEGYPCGDYGAFEEAGIPWIYFEATNWTLGDQDGYTQVNPQYGDGGAIFHTEYDDLSYLEDVFPGRVDQHLDLFGSVLYHLLSEFGN